MPPHTSPNAAAAIASFLLHACAAAPDTTTTSSTTVFGSGMAAITSVLQIAATTLAIMLFMLLFLVYVQPRWFIRFMAWASHPSVLWCVNTSARVCSLTIDDAPSASTPLILDILKQYNVKATFFIISDRIAGNEEVVHRIVREGHTLGNHLTEDRASVLDALHVFEQKLQECDRAIRAYQPDVPAPVVPLAAVAAVADEVRKVEAETTKLLSGSNGAPSATPVRWLRPASGWFTSSMREIIQTNGYRICLGSVYPHDAQIKFEFLNALHLRTFTGNGSVIIVHDRKWTVGVLQAALPALTKKLKFVSLNELVLHE
ncbi:Carbohydrate esterase, partial [Globisporangium splendens]